MKNRPHSDSFVSNGCSSSASAGNLPKFEGGSSNTLAAFLTEKFEAKVWIMYLNYLYSKTNFELEIKEYRRDNGAEADVNYKAMSCNNAEDAEYVKVRIRNIQPNHSKSWQNFSYAQVRTHLADLSILLTTTTLQAWKKYFFRKMKKIQ